MSFRRFVNLVASDCAKNNYTLRRIDMSWFFLPTMGVSRRSSLFGMDPPPVEEDCCLPEATMNFYPPQRTDSHGRMDFMLLKNKVVATNEESHALMYDPDMPAFHHLPCFKQYRSFPISIAVGNNLYLLDKKAFNGNNCRSFEALVYRPLIPQEHGWEWHPLPPMPQPPFISNCDKDPTCIRSLATVQGGNHIWVSISRGDIDGADTGCTYSFDTKKLMWSRPVDWLLPFCGVAEYVQLHELWFGISSSDHGSVFCASKLTAGSISLEDCDPPVLHEAFDDMVGSPKEWRLLTSHAVHLGSGKFCIARFFDRTRPHIQGIQLWDNCVVFTGVEALNCNGKLHMVKHRSKRYMLHDEEHHFVL